MKKLILALLFLAGLAPAQTVLDGGRTQTADSVKWGDNNDSTTSLLVRKTAKFRDSSGTWRSISGAYDSCSLPVWISVGTRKPNSKFELSYEVRTSTGNTDSSQVKIKADTRYCRYLGDTTRCEGWVSAGRFQGDTTAIIYDSIITAATTAGTTWKPTRTMFDVPGGDQIRLCLDGYKTGAQTNDSTFFRRFVLRTSAVAAGGTPPASVTVSGGAIATATNQTSGGQKTQLVDGAGNVIGSTTNALDVNIKSGSGSGVSVTDSATWTTNSSVMVPAGGVYQVTQTANPLATGRQGTAQMTRFRALHSNLRDSTGAVIGNSANPLRTDPTGSTTQPVSGTVTANAGTGTFAVSAASLPLPSGAATAAKQPALGTAGSPSTDVISIQGVASGTVVPISAASLPLPSTAATSTKQSDGSQKSQIVDGSGNVIASTANALNVQCANCSGSGVSATDEAAFTAGSSTFAPGGGIYQVTQTSNPLTTGQQGAFQTTRFRALHVNLRDSAGAVIGNSTTPLQVSLANTGSNGTNVNVTCSNCSGSGVSAADAATFTATSTSQALVGGFYQTTATSNALTTGQQGALQVTANRALFVNPRNSSGTEIATASNPYRVDPTGTTPQPASQSGTWNITNVSGTVSLPTGASTAAKQPALGTAGTASADVITVQGIASMTALKTDGSAVTQPVSGTVTANAGSGTFANNVSQINGVTPLMGNGVTGTGSQRVTIASDNTAFTVNAAQSGTWTVQPGNTANTTAWKVDNSAVNQPVVGAVAHDAVGTSTNPALTGGYASAAAPTDVSADGDAVRAWHLRSGAYVTQPTYGGVLQSTGNGTAGTGTPRVTIASDNTAFSVNAAQATASNLNAQVVGVAAHDAAVSGNPLLTGAEARTSNGTAVQNGDITRLQATIEGKLVTRPHSVYGATWTYAAASGGITNTTAATMKAAAGAGVRNCLTGIQVINGHATVSTEVVVRDGAAGTVVWRGFAQAAGGGAAANFDVPICGTANTLMEVADITTGAAVYVNAQGYTSAE